MKNTRFTVKDGGQIDVTSMVTVTIPKEDAVRFHEEYDLGSTEVRDIMADAMPDAPSSDYLIDYLREQVSTNGKQLKALANERAVMARLANAVAAAKELGISAKDLAALAA